MKINRLKFLLAVVTMALTISVFAADPLIFDDAEQEARYQQLTVELRCLVCQNQNLADSDAPLAQDLRREIYEMMQAGRSDNEIKQFLIDRYGDFVLYKPPVKNNTLLLWFLPAFLLAGGALVVLMIVRKRKLISDGQDEGISS